ncbi:MAG: hypothetical protein LC772_05870, partial [Chloroflexi bacterium]|nr:hypothetical protein [Chloroflexota bacterium]
HKVWAEYDYPTWKLKKTEEIDVIGRGMVHEEWCSEIRCREYRPDGAVERDRYAYAEIRDGLERWFGWWNMADELKFYTYTDKDFAWDWGEVTPMRTVDAGRFRWLDERHLETVPMEALPGVNPDGAGHCLLKIGTVEHRCLRYVDGTRRTGGPHVLGDRFVNSTGRALLQRYYYWSEFQMDNWPAPAREFLAGAPTMTCDGVDYYLWYDRIAEEGLAAPPHA